MQDPKLTKASRIISNFKTNAMKKTDEVIKVAEDKTIIAHVTCDSKASPETITALQEMIKLAHKNCK